MQFVVNAKRVWDFVIDKPEPLPGYYIQYPHTKKAIAFGITALVLIAAIGIIAFAIFSGSNNIACQKVCQGMARHHSIIPVTFAIGGILSASFLFTFFCLIRSNKISPMFIETKTKNEDIEKWHQDTIQPIYVDYDPNSLHAYLMKNYQNNLIMTSVLCEGKVFVDNPSKRISQNPDQLIHIETGLTLP